MWYGMFLRDFVGSALLLKETLGQEPVPDEEDGISLTSRLTEHEEFVELVEDEFALIGPLYEQAFKARGPPTRKDLELTLEAHLEPPVPPSAVLSLGERMRVAVDVLGVDAERAVDARERYMRDGRRIADLRLGELRAIADEAVVSVLDLTDERRLDRYRGVYHHYRSVLPTRLPSRALLPQRTRYAFVEAAVMLDLYAHLDRPHAPPGAILKARQ